LRPRFFQAHSILATVLIYVLAVHVLAALQHHFFYRDAVLKRMLPATKVE
jgi:cytochrome b561